MPGGHNHKAILAPLHFILSHLVFVCGGRFTSSSKTSVQYVCVTAKCTTKLTCHYRKTEAVVHWPHTEKNGWNVKEDRAGYGRRQKKMMVKSQMDGWSGRNDKVGVARTTQGSDRRSGEGWSGGSLDVGYDMTETRIRDESRAKRVLDTYNYTEER